MGEDIGATGVREVFEETGIRSTFKDILLFRHLHNPPQTAFGRSDMFFMVHLEATSLEICIDPSEISECVWMPVDAFVAQCAHPLNKWAAAAVGTRLKHPSTRGETGGGGSISQHIVEELVHIPSTKRTVRVYRSGASGPICLPN